MANLERFIEDPNDHTLMEVVRSLQGYQDQQIETVEESVKTVLRGEMEQQIIDLGNRLKGVSVSEKHVCGSNPGDAAYCLEHGNPNAPRG